MAEGPTPSNDAYGREEHMLVLDQPPSSSTKSLGKVIQDGITSPCAAELIEGIAPKTKSLGKAIQAYDEEHNGAASSTKLIPKANADCMTHIDMDETLKSTPVPKKNQPPKILSYINGTRDHSLSRDEGPEYDPRASNYGHDDSIHTGESSTTRSFGVIRDGITSPCAADLAKGTAAASSSMKSVIPDGPSIEENVNPPLGGPSSSTPSLMKAVQDAPGSEEYMLAVRLTPSSSTKSLGKAIQDYDEEHDEAVSSTKIILKAIAVAACLVQMQPDAGPSVRVPGQHHDGIVVATGGPTQANAGDVASNITPAIPVFAQHDVNVAIAGIGGAAAHVTPAQPNAARQVSAPAQINGGGIAVITARPVPAQPDVARRVPAPAQINGGGIAMIVARPAPAQPNARGRALNAAPPIPILPPNPGLNNIDEALTISVIQPLRNPTDGDEGKIWDKLN